MWRLGQNARVQTKRNNCKNDLKCSRRWANIRYGVGLSLEYWRRYGALTLSSMVNAGPRRSYTCTSHLVCLSEATTLGNMHAACICPKEFFWSDKCRHSTQCDYCYCLSLLGYDFNIFVYAASSVSPSPSFSRSVPERARCVIFISGAPHSSDLWCWCM